MMSVSGIETRDTAFYKAIEAVKSKLNDQQKSSSQPAILFLNLPHFFVYGHKVAGATQRLVDEGRSILPIHNKATLRHTTT